MKKTDKPRKIDRFLHALLAAPARFILRVRVKGRENIPQDGGYVMLCNHMSFLDPIVLSAAFPRKRMPKYLAKAELFRIPVLRGIIRMFGAIPVERGRGDVGAIRRSVDVARGGEILAVFPQGTRMPGKEPSPDDAKSGIGMMAYRGKSNILPVFIKTKKHKISLFRKVTVIVGKPIMFEDLGFTKGTIMEYRAASRYVFEKICELNEDKENGN